MFSILDCCYASSVNILEKLKGRKLPKWNKDLSNVETINNLIHSYGGHLIMETGGENSTSYHILFPNSGPEKSTHILVVDDDFSSTQFMSQVFKTKGFRVTPMCDSTAALRHFKKNADKYDLAFIDFYMPGLNGIELASALLKIKPDLEIVFCTAHLNIDEHQTKSIGVSAIIYKPMRIKQILDLTEILLLPKQLAHNTLEPKPTEEAH